MSICRENSTSPTYTNVWQNDLISPVLVTTVLKDPFKLFDYNRYGISINGECFTRLRSAEDVVVMAESMNNFGTLFGDLKTVEPSTLEKETFLSSNHELNAIALDYLPPGGPTTKVAGFRWLQVVQDIVEI
ncbi:hypothetical protein EVAR_49387_1 [Eumeta japonica]|uniref:Uncharacterized protein n=1 Tax=Eumeta variegata TaxID=151549 RepID=A0A4C1YRC1_EUMVA|nr:hypothetical protein EVAR_49387_1 [Eumeta japonica]